MEQGYPEICTTSFLLSHYGYGTLRIEMLEECCCEGPDAPCAAVAKWCTEARAYLECGEKLLLWLSNIYISIRSYHLHPLPEGPLKSYFLSFSLLKIKGQTKIKQAMSLICYTACDSSNYFSWNHMRPKEKWHVLFVILLLSPCFWIDTDTEHCGSSGSWGRNLVSCTVRRRDLSFSAPRLPGPMESLSRESW